MTTDHFHPNDPAFAERVRASFDRQPFMHHIGARVIDVAPGRCAIHLPHRPELTQQHGYFHAGIIGTMADNAGGYAALSLMPPGKEVLTVEYKLNLLHPGRGEGITSRGQVIKVGRTLTICRADVFNVIAGSETLAATAMLTMMAVDARQSA
ncbi:MAG: PaaI family thioesterase [Desulfosarcina sp.]